MDDAERPKLSRRRLLQSGVGAIGLAGLSGRVGGDERPRAEASRVDDHTGDVVSLRSLAEFVDHDHPPRRLFGNGPPFEPDRSSVDAAEKVRYCETPGCQTGDTRRYVEFHGPADENAYDLGMANRTEDGLPAGVDLRPKGLIEHHRWDESGDDGATPAYRSIRTVTDRHAEGVTHRCAWLNTRLLDTYSNRGDRARSIGRMFGDAGYEVVTLGEVDGAARALDVAEEYANRYATVGGTIDSSTDKGPFKRNETNVSPEGALADQLGIVYGPHRPGQQALKDTSGLLSVVGERDGGRRLDNADRVVFDTNPASAIQVSYQRLGITVDVPGDAGFDLFLTHLSADQDPPIGSRAKKRGEQLEELASAIAGRQDDRPGWPKIVVGDLNVHADSDFEHFERADYRELLEDMNEIGLQDAWLTHGGPVGRTIRPRSHAAADGRFDGHCHRDDFELSQLASDGRDPGRLDYVFVERLRSRHEVTVDLSRIWRIATTRSCQGLHSLAEPGAFSVSRENQANTLTDHAGLGFELLVAPN